MTYVHNCTVEAEPVKINVSQKSARFQNKISMEHLFYGPHLLAKKISESYILSIQYYAESNFCVVNTIAPP